MNMLLALHNLLRWAVLLAGLYAITKSALGLIRKRDYTSSENRAHLIFLIFCHTQLLLGVILSIIKLRSEGGWSASAFSIAEHMSTMVLAIIFVQTGRTLSKKTTDAVQKHKRTLIWFSIALVLMLSRIPWNASPMMRMP